MLTFRAFTSLHIMCDNLIQGFQTTVMHVRVCERNIPKGWCLKKPNVGTIQVDSKTAFIRSIVLLKTIVLRLEIGKVWGGVTGGTIQGVE